MNLMCDDCHEDFNALLDGVYTSEYVTLCANCAPALTRPSLSGKARR